jgi:hypothetical protein
MDRASVIERNRVELGRLRELLAQLSDEQLALPLEGGWSVGSTLAHLAFWDQRAVFLLERWEQQGVGPSEMDVDIVNRACLPQWLALAPRVAADLTLKTAEAIDKKIEAVSQEIFDWCATNRDCPINIERARHRAEHIEQIREAVKSR